MSYVYLTCGNTAASVEADLQFHLAILDATHNSFMRPFDALIQAALRASLQLTNQDAVAYQVSRGTHRDIQQAIEQKQETARIKKSGKIRR